MSDGKFAVALHDYAAKNATQISFSKNDMLCVTHEDSTKQWFKGFVCFQFSFFSFFFFTVTFFFRHLEDKPDVVGLFPVSYVRLEPGYVPKSLQKALKTALGKDDDHHHHHNKSQSNKEKEKEKEKEHKEKEHKDKEHKETHKDSKKEKSDVKDKRHASVEKDIGGSGSKSSSPSSKSSKKEKKSSVDDSVASVSKSSSAAKLETRSSRSSTLGGESTAPPLPPLHTSATVERPPVTADEKSPHHHHSHSSGGTSSTSSATSPSSKQLATSKKKSSSKTSGLSVSSVASVNSSNSNSNNNNNDNDDGSSGAKSTPRHLTVDNFDTAMEYERRVRSKDVRNDELSAELLVFPANDLRVVTVPRPLRQCHGSAAAVPSLPGDAEPHLKMALSASSRDFVAVHHKSRDSLAKAAPTPPGGAVDKGEKEKLLRSPLVDSGSGKRQTTTLPKDTDREYNEAEGARVASSLQQHRQHVLDLYVRSDRIDPIHTRAPAMLAEAPRFATQLRVTMLNLKFNVDVGEAFFLSVALYDLRARQKLCETWHVDLNSDEVLLQFEDRKRGRMHAETRARSALFGVASDVTRERARDIVLVVRIERVACPDEAAGVELYCRSELKPKDAEKARAATEGARAMLGNVLQPFAWTYARPFAEESGSGITVGGGSGVGGNGGNGGDEHDLRTPRSVLVFDRLFKVKADRVRDDVLYDEIRKRDENTDKSALIPGSLECAVAVLQGAAAVQQLGGRLDTSLRVLQPTPDEDVKLIAKHKLPRTPLVRELCAFGAAPGPQLEYTSHVHVHCEWLDLHNDAATVNARNIVCSIALCLDDRAAGAPGAELVYGGASLPRLVAEISSPLTYRTRRPQYYFEAKVELPVRIPRGAHLLFTLRHTACRIKAGGLFSLEAKEDATGVLGYACLPLLAIDAPDDEPRADDDDGEGAAAPAAARERRARDDISPLQVLADGEHLLSVAKSLPAHYLNAYVDESPEISWSDKKPVFQCRTRLCSSVHTNNAALALFFSSAKEGASADELRVAHRHLAAVDAALLTTHFASVIDQLIAAIAFSRSGGAKWAFGALVDTVLRIDSHTRGAGKATSRNAMLDAYLYYLSLGGADAAHLVQKLLDTFVDAWTKCLDDAETRAAEWHNALWFLLGLLGKVVTVACAHRNALDESSARSTRISEQNAQSLRALVERLTSEMLAIAPRAPSALVTVNRSLALFFSDLFAVIDRGFVFDLLLIYTRRLRAGAASRKTSAQTRVLLGKLRIELHGQLASYEHYVQLNLPLPFSFRSASSMRADWWRRHFLVGLLIDECAQALAGDDRLVKHAAATTLRSVLATLARTSRSAEAQRRVVDMFFPLLQLLSDNALHVTGDEDEDEDDSDESDESSAAGGGAGGGGGGGGGGGSDERSSSSSSRKTSVRKLHSVRTMRSPPTVSSKPFDLFGVLRKKTNIVTTPSGNAPSQAAVAEAKRADEMAQALVDAERRDWLACVLHIVTECSRDLLTKWLRNERNAPLGAFCSLIVAAVRRFAADGCHDLLAREACVCAQSVVVLLFGEVPKELASNEHLRLDAFRIIVQLLVAAPPVDVLLNTFTLVRRFLHEQTKAVFVGDDSTYAASLCYHVLRYCGSPHDEVRSAAAALWLRLASTNMRAAGNFSRVKLQSTIAMSSLAGGAVALDSSAMKSALEAAVRHVTAEDGKRSWALNSHTSLRGGKAGSGGGGGGGGGSGNEDDEGEFDKQLSALTQRLFGVIKNSIMLSEIKEDPEMEADLLHRLSLNYVESPVLRVTWLDNLASKHVTHHRWAEAGCCYVLIASLGAAFLRKREGTQAAIDKAGVPLDDAVFRAICAHLKVEPGLPELEQPGIYDSPSFSRDGLHAALNSAVGCLLKADLYELAIKVYGMLIALHISHDDYGRLARISLQLPAHCEKLVKLRDNESRIFPNYYCVSFHGSPWNEFSSRQYVYMASAEHRVAEFTELMRLRFEKRFLPNTKVRVLAANESAESIKSKCAAESGVAFVQIAAVRPHASANTKRKTEFDMNHNVGRFALEQPFVPGGGAYGQTSKQWKRRLVYKCTSTFPHLSPRLLVVDVDERQLSPLACAIETIAGRADQLSEEVAAPVPDVKQLQLLLQGSVLLQVNAGPLEIANVFLRSDFVAAKDDLAPGEKSDALQSKLRGEFRRFIGAAADAVKLNGTLVGADQAEFQNELEKGLERTKGELSKFQID
jgi:uncharacterized membrane protein YgcG